MVERKSSEGRLGTAVGLYVAFCVIVALGNAISALGRGSETMDALGGLLMLLGGMTFVGLALPLFFSRRGDMELMFLPVRKSHWVVLLGLLAAFLFARNEYVVDLLRSPRPLGQSVAVFCGPVLVHLASMVMCFGVLLPPLRRRWGGMVAVLLTAVAWCVYHALQFYYFPDGLTPAMQFELFCFGLGYALFYLWSGSLLYTYALQHLVAVSTFIYNRDFGFGEVDEPFVMNIGITLLALVYILWKQREHRDAQG
jgi:membrane protease YdiL (CAAX protease family)